MEAFFGGDKSGINVSEFSGKLGTMLQGMETALNEGNTQLAMAEKNLDIEQNNCWNCTINLTTDGKVDSKSLTTDLNSMIIAKNFDKALENYQNVSSPQTGDAIRFSADGGRNTTHGSVFLLQNDNGIQTFTKNGLSNLSPYQIMLVTEMPATYGQMVGKTGYQKEVTVENALTKQSTTETRTVSDSSPYYRR